MRKRVLITAFLFLLFGLIAFLNDVPRDPLTVGRGDATSTDMPLSSEETDSFKELPGAEQKRGAIQSGFVDQEKRQAPAFEQRRKPNSSLLVPKQGAGAGQRSDVPRMAQTRQMLLPYMRSLRLRATQAGLPPHQVARISAEVTAVAWRAQAAGVPAAQAVGSARRFGDKALNSSEMELERLSVISGVGRAAVGGGAQQMGNPGEAFVRRIQAYQQQQK